MESPIDPNPAIVHALMHLMKTRERRGSHPEFKGESIHIPKRILAKYEPVPVAVQRLGSLTKELNFEMSENSEAVTLTLKKLA